MKIFKNIGSYIKKHKIAAAALSFVILATGAVYAAESAGSTSDPLVTLSYINGQFKTELLTSLINSFDKTYADEMKDKIKEEIYDDVVSQVKKDISDGKIAVDANTGYDVVYVQRGHSISSTNSCEIILRSGEAVCFVYDQKNIDAKVGLSDCTSGSEILNGNAIPQNHILIVPRADGRGVTVTSSDAYFMVRGDYKID